MFFLFQLTNHFDITKTIVNQKNGDYTKNKNFSDIVAHEIDEEMRSIINTCYEKSKKILKENKDLLKLIAETLLEEETITKEQIEYLVENGHVPNDVDVMKTDEDIEEFDKELEQKEKEKEEKNDEK